MSFHHGGWRAFIRYDEQHDRPELSWRLLRTVAAYAWPYWGQLAVMIGLILITSLLNLMPSLLYRDLLDNALPNRNEARLNLLAGGVIGGPLIVGLIGVAQRFLGPALERGSSTIYGGRTTPTCSA